MEIKKIICETGREYNIINESWENNQGWGHKSTLLLGTCIELKKAKIKYLNRTWEMYTYQSCMYKVLEDYKQECLYNYIERYKQENNISKFKSGEKQKVIDDFENTIVSKELKEIEERIRDRNFN